MIEICNEKARRNRPITTAVFDFDGTISTLRENWESIMRKMMLEQICPLSPGEAYPPELLNEVDRYIDESTGIQTAFQMEWLQNKVISYGKNKQAQEHDLWWYKDEYNRHLLEMVHSRINRLANGELKPEDFRIQGSLSFCQTLHQKGVKIYIASGTDHIDLTKEVEILGLSPYLTDVKGAPSRQISCSKEKVLQDLLQTIPPQEVAVFGDGKVEIQLGHQAGAVTIATATDEKNLHGINPVKREKLIGAGADVVVGDFNQPSPILGFLGF